MLMTHRLFFCLLTLVLASLAGCASGPNQFDAVTAEGVRGRQARYVLESTAGNEGSITIEAQGEPLAAVDGRTTDTMRFTLTADNASDDAIVIYPAELGAIDDQGRKLLQVAAFLPPGSPAGIFRIEPRTRTSMEVVFDTGAPNTLETTGSIAFQWEYEYQGADRAHETRFLPTRVYRRDVYYPAWSFGVGYGRGYYGPVW